MEIKATVDRIEEDQIVLLVRPDELHIIHWPVQAMPFRVREGDILSISVRKDHDETRQAEDRVRALLEKLTSKQREPKP